MLNVALVTSSIAITVGLYKINIGANFHRQWWRLPQQENSS